MLAVAEGGEAETLARRDGAFEGVDFDGFFACEEGAVDAAGRLREDLAVGVSRSTSIGSEGAS